MPRVTALHPERRERVRVELDGRPWRTLPAAAVVAAGLRPGVELDRSRARELRRAVARSEALTSAAAALSRRDHSVAGLDAALERRGVPPAERERALATMSRLRYLDDERFAHGRAAALAERNYGDEAIRFKLEAEGLEPDRVELALAALEPEPERARRFTAKFGSRPGAARSLAARGFSLETIESVLGLPDA
jgi:SOS response regulatory protein OraA/RecX